MADSLFSLSLLIPCLVIIIVYLRRPGRRLPPGPKGLPLIGNVLDMPKSHAWMTFAEWGKKYGDITYISVLGKPIVIINTQAAAIALLEKKGSAFSDRPIFWMTGEIGGRNKSLPLCPYGTRVREARKLFHAVVGGRNAEQFYELQERESLRLLKKLSDDPSSFAEHIRWFVGDVILHIAYGYSVADKDDHYINLAEKVLQEFSDLSIPGVWLVEFMPFLRHIPTWFPGVEFKRRALAFRDLAFYSYTETPYKTVKNQMAQGTAQPSFVTNAMEAKPDRSPEYEDIAMWAANDCYGAGSDTSASALWAFFLAMTMYPSIQKRAQDELDSVLGHDGQPRLPGFSDRGKLPYTNALVKEVLRWACIVPSSVPRATHSDEGYKGYTIPKGTLVITNAWALLNDSNVYSDPDEFKPERYLGPSLESDPRSIVFGHGRRICPGMTLAENTIFITVCRVLACFNISALPRQQPTREFIDGVLTHPVPFKCSIIQRPSSDRSSAKV